MFSLKDTTTPTGRQWPGLIYDLIGRGLCTIAGTARECTRGEHLKVLGEAEPGTITRENPNIKGTKAV